MLILWVFETDVFVVEKGLFAIKNVENRFLTIYFRDLWYLNKGGYWGLQGSTGGYKWLQGVTRGYRELPGVTLDDKGWHWVTRDYTDFLRTRTLPDTFSWSILHKNQSWGNLKFLTKTTDKPLWKNSYFLFFINSCFYSL